MKKYEVLYNFIKSGFSTENYYYHNTDYNNMIILYINDEDNKNNNLNFFIAYGKKEGISTINIRYNKSVLIITRNVIQLNYNLVSMNSKEEYFEFQLMNDIPYSYEEVLSLLEVLKSIPEGNDINFYPECL